MVKEAESRSHAVATASTVVLFTTAQYATALGVCSEFLQHVQCQSRSRPFSALVYFSQDFGANSARIWLRREEDGDDGEVKVREEFHGHSCVASRVALSIFVRASSLTGRAFCVE